MSVENVTPFGLWLFVKEKEYFLSYQEYPFFRDQTLKSIQDVRLLHGHHLHWPELDVDLEVDNLENPERYPLKSAVAKPRPTECDGLAKSRTDRNRAKPAR